MHTFSSFVIRFIYFLFSSTWNQFKNSWLDGHLEKIAQRQEKYGWTMVEGETMKDVREIYTYHDIKMRWRKNVGKTRKSIFSEGWIGVISLPSIEITRNSQTFEDAYPPSLVKSCHKNSITIVSSATLPDYKTFFFRFHFLFLRSTRRKTRENLLPK